MKSSLLKILSALIAGLLTNIAFEPAGLFPLVFLTLGILFWTWSESSARICAWCGFHFGLGFYGFGVHWIYYSLHNFGGAAPILAGFMVLALVCFLSGLVATCGYLQARLRVSLPIRCLAVIPASWVTVEWIRSWLLTGFPWLYAGYSQTDSWLSGWAPILGVLGVSFMVCMIAGALVCWTRQGFRADIVALLLVTVMVGYLGKAMNWTTSTHAPIKVAIIQADVNIFDKWDYRKALSNLDFFVTRSQSLINQDLVIWPEIAVVQTDKRLEKLQLWRLLMDLSPDFLLGVVEEQTDGKTTLHYNSAYGITSNIQKYRKRRLVPFGEFTPFRPLLGWLDEYIDIPASDFSSYQEVQEPLLLAGQPAAISICYEDAFPHEYLGMLAKSTYLVNLSEDAWFGEWLAPFQRLQMSRMRALEVARPVLRVANKGISAHIDHKGQVVAQLPQSEGYLLRVQITPTSGSTFYLRFGNVPVLILCAITLLVPIARATVARNRH